MATEKHAGFVDDPLVNRGRNYAVPTTINTSLSRDAQSFYHESAVLFVEDACADGGIHSHRENGQVTIA